MKKRTQHETKELGYKLVNSNEEKAEHEEELNNVNRELIFQNREKEKLAGKLIVANKELAYQYAEKEKRSAELVIANIEKAKRSAELAIANIEKAKRAAELVIANKELIYQKDEKSKRSAELVISKVLEAKNAAELVIANIEKAKRAAEFIILGKELVLSQEKGKLIDELTSLNEELSHEIEKRKQSEVALEEREKEFCSLAESMPQIVWTTRADGWNTYFNQQWVDYTGLTLEESYGHGWNIPFHPEDKQLAWEAWQNAVNKNAKYSIESRIMCHDGTYHWWLVRGVPQISVDGEILKWFGTCTDIEKIKETEKTLLHSEKQLLRHNADKDRFISILGHDLKNPFNSILGFSEILINEIESLNKEKIKDFASSINKSVTIANKLLEEIMMWARAQQGIIPFQPKLLTLTDIFKNVHDSYDLNARAKNITINYLATDNQTVFADNDMLKTILRNLVSNAIKFTNSGGKIDIQAERKTGIVTISVSDNGIGISSDNLAKMFDISEVLTTKGTAGETGTGLGLLLCKEFAEKHGGNIWVESEVGKGSNFKFTLPLLNERAL